MSTPTKQPGRPRGELHGKHRHFGWALIQARRSAGVSAPELARRLGVPTTTVNRWERGTRRPDVDAIAAIAEAIRPSDKTLLIDLLFASIRRRQ